MLKSQNRASGRIGIVLVGLMVLALAFGTCEAWCQTIIVDDLSSNVTWTGAWAERMAPKTHHATTYRDITSSIQGTSLFVWTPEIPSPGDYEVSVWYPAGANNVSKATYIVTGTEMKSYTVNQRQNSGSWVPLGVAGFVEGTTTAKIALRNSSDDIGMKVAADAVRLVKLGTEYSSQYQGAWVYSWGKGILSEEQTTNTIAECRDYNLNAIFPEIRKTGDAYYISEIEPRATNIDEDYEDPLADILKKARDISKGQSLEVHGWFVPFRVWVSGTPPEGHVTLKHPEWMTYNYQGTRNGSDLDPGVPEVSDYLTDVLIEVVENYDIDGIQLDYIRYNGNDLGYNPASVSRFQTLYGRSDRPLPDDPEFCEFRRQQVLGFVRKAYAKLKEVRWDLKLSASTVTWLPAPPEGDFTVTRPYGDVFSDWVTMMREGSLDINIPMVYMRDHNNSQYDCYRSWVDTAAEHSYGRQVIIGPGSYLNYIHNNISQMLYARDQENVHGLMPYRFGFTSIGGENEEESWRAMVADVFDVTREIPAASWLTEPTTGILYGKVRDIAGNIIDGATVTVDGFDPVASDGTGFYAFLKLNPGEDQIVRASFGDMKGQGTFTILAGEVTQLDITIVGEAMKVSPMTDVIGTGYQGGPFQPASTVYSVSNGSPETIVWSVEAADTWLSLEPSSGTSAGGEIKDVTVSFNQEALAFEPGVYGSSVTFKNQISDYETIRSVTLTIVDNFDISIDEDIEFYGRYGGPFTPEEISLTIHNFGEKDIPWSATSDQTWVEVQPSSGILQKGMKSVDVSCAVSAQSLPGRSEPYSANLVFRNESTGNEATAEIKLTITNIAKMPFLETFEKPLESYWELSGTYGARTYINGSNQPYQGSQHLLMDSYYPEHYYSRNEMTLHIDLSHQKNVMLQFWAKGFSDEPDGPPEAPFEDGADFDGVAVSDDGENWFEIHSLRDLESAYTLQQVSLDEAIKDVTVEYNEKFLIRFNHYGNKAIPEGGFGIDYITITSELNDAMQVLPEEPFRVTGDRWDVYEPERMTYDVINQGTADMVFTISTEADWLVVDDLVFVAPPREAHQVAAAIDAGKAQQLGTGTHEAIITFTNVDTGASVHRKVILRNMPTDYVTEHFDLFDNDLELTTLEYYWNQKTGSYVCCEKVADVTRFYDTSSGNKLLLGDNANAKLAISGTSRIKFFGKEYREFFVNSNGYVTFEKADNGFTESILEHFQLPRISVMFDDFDPSVIGAAVNWNQLQDRVIVTWLEVPEFDTSNGNSFQLEMYYDGRIRMTYARLDSEDGLVGLSEGKGVPYDFVESDLTTCSPCTEGMILIVK